HPEAEEARVEDERDEERLLRQLLRHEIVLPDRVQRDGGLAVGAAADVAPLLVDLSERGADEDAEREVPALRRQLGDDAGAAVEVEARELGDAAPEAGVVVGAGGGPAQAARGVLEARADGAPLDEADGERGEPDGEGGAARAEEERAAHAERRVDDA